MGMLVEGYRVLDWTVWQQGPVASVMPGDLGVVVSKIEERGRGDAARGLMSLAGASAGVAGHKFFEKNNRNKKSLVVGLRKDKDGEIVYKLAGKPDVFTGGIVLRATRSCRAMTIGHIFLRNLIQECIMIPSLLFISDTIDLRGPRGSMAGADRFLYGNGPGPQKTDVVRRQPWLTR